MAKFVKIPIQDQLIDSEAAGTTVSGKLTLADTSTLTVGDYVHNETDSTYATITVVDSATLVTLSANICVATEVVSVYSATSATVTRTISAERYLLAVQPIAVANAIGVTTINYASGGTDVLTITHSGNQLAATTTAVAFEDAIVTAFSTKQNPDNYKLVELPAGVGVFTLAIA